MGATIVSSGRAATLGQRSAEVDELLLGLIMLYVFFERDLKLTTRAACETTDVSLA